MATLAVVLTVRYAGASAVAYALVQTSHWIAAVVLMLVVMSAGFEVKATSKKGEE